MDLFKSTIKKYLDERAQKDKLFASAYSTQGKTIDECVKYILTEVKKSGREGFCDEEIYGMAVHYYDEDNLTIDNDIDAQVVVNHSIELTEEEKKRLRDEALLEFKEEQLSSLKRRFQSVNSEQLKRNKSKEEEEEMPSLF